MACATGLASAGCEPELLVGDWGCFDTETSLYEGAVTAPWSTGFEDGFCGYEEARGYCYATGGGSFDIVDSPVRSGKRAAAFTVITDGEADEGQARCVIEGEFPSEAYYSAWYFIPELAINTGNWNLVHFQGGSLTRMHHLWDISIESTRRVGPRFYMLDFVSDEARTAEERPTIPIGRWFQLEFFWKRANDTTGEVALYQDGELVIEATEIRTDDTTWGQWYLGNLADALMPSVSTVYVDDVELRESP